MASLAMGLACALVGLGGLFNDELSSDDNGDDDENDGNDAANDTRAQYGLVLELLGVSFMSFQCSLGEASLLALAGKFDGSLLPRLSSTSVSSSSMDSYSAVDNDNNIRFESHEDIDEGLFAHEEEEHNNNHNEQPSSSATLMKTEQQPRKCITAFASGTGLAGIVGYAYKSLLAELFGWGLSYIVWSAILFAIVYYRIYCTGLYEMDIRLEEAVSRNRLEGERCASSLAEADGVEELNDGTIEQRSSLEMAMQPQDGEEENGSSTLLSQYSAASTTTATESVHHMTAWERFKTVCSLWPYMIPLFFVYMTEYMMVSHYCEVAFCRSACI